MVSLDKNNRVAYIPLMQIPNEKGDVFHAVKKSDNHFKGFGEAYFTTVKNGAIKGWKKHTLMHMNLVVIHGEVCFYLIDDQNNWNASYTLGPKNYGCLSVSPGIWVAFKGLTDQKNIILNVASEPHVPEEAITKPLSDFPLW